MIREPNIVVALHRGALGPESALDGSCRVTDDNPGARYTNTRNREILNELIIKQVNDVEVIGKGVNWFLNWNKILLIFK